MPFQTTDCIDDTAGKSKVYATVTIPSGARNSNPLYIGDSLSLVGFTTPDALDGASLLFLASINGTVWYNVGNSSGTYFWIPSPALNVAYSLDLQLFQPWRWIIVQTTINQTASRNFTMVMRAMA
jgi:hypothetical protein